MTLRNQGRSSRTLPITPWQPGMTAGSVADADVEVLVERTDVNPWDWSIAFGYSQAVQISGGGRILFCAGQTATGPDGAPPTTTDVGEQMRMAFANLRTVLEASDMTIADIVRLTVYTTDVDGTLAGYGAAAEALAQNLPAITLIGVSRLAFPELKIEIEATAVR